MQQQAHPQAPPMFNAFGGSPQNPSVPDFAAWGMNDATAQLGMQLGHSAVAAGQDYVQKNVSDITLLSFLASPY
jgi:protein transport protein YIF1